MDAPEHHMITRARFMDLPPELRNRIFHYAFVSDDPINLNGMELPRCLMVNHRLLQEMLPVFLTSHKFHGRVRLNYAIRGDRFVRSGDRFFELTGRLPVTVSGPRAAVDLVKQCPLGRHVVVDVFCACCETARVLLGTLELIVKHGKPAMRYKFQTPCLKTTTMSVATINGAMQDAENIVNGFKSLDRFPAWTIDQVRAVAQCFRVQAESSWSS